MNNFLIAILAVLIIGGVGFYALFYEADDTTDLDVTTVIDRSEDRTPSTNSRTTTNEPVPTSSSIALEENTAGSEVMVADAQLAEDGYIVLYQVHEDDTVSVLGSTELLSAGSYRDLRVPVTATLADSESVIASLFLDDGDGSFNVEDDTIMMAADGTLATDIDVIGREAADEAVELLDQAEAILVTELEIEAEANINE